MRGGIYVNRYAYEFLSKRTRRSKLLKISGGWGHDSGDSRIVRIVRIAVEGGTALTVDTKEPI